jgi:hypothetical protein
MGIIDDIHAISPLIKLCGQIVAALIPVLNGVVIQNLTNPFADSGTLYLGIFSVPVTVFWITFNVAIGLLLDRFGLLNPRTALVWTLFYFVFDLFSVVLWCPLQLALMRNRCCTTCQIFNWDGIMTVTPLLVCWCWFSVSLVLLALVVLVRWELAFARHPERFDERTNASLQCANCKDKLCYLRNPLTPPRHG